MGELICAMLGNIPYVRSKLAYYDAIVGADLCLCMRKRTLKCHSIWLNWNSTTQWNPSLACQARGGRGYKAANVKVTRLARPSGVYMLREAFQAIASCHNTTPHISQPSCQGLFESGRLLTSSLGGFVVHFNVWQPSLWLLSLLHPSAKLLEVVSCLFIFETD